MKWADKTMRFIASALALVVLAGLFSVSALGEEGGAQAPFVKVVARQNHTLAIRADSTLWAWGDNLYGQIRGALGQSDSERERWSTPEKIMDGVVDVAAGWRHTLVVKKDGGVWTWGTGWEDTTNAEPGVSDEGALRLIPNLHNVVAVAAGYGHSLALQEDGTLWAWGDKPYGQLGDGTGASAAEPVKALEDVRFVAAGVFNTFAIKTDGTLWGWGDNSFDQLGVDSTGHEDRYMTPKQIEGMNNVVRVAAAFSCTLAVGADGSLWSWGDNTFGQLGDAGRASDPMPREIEIKVGDDTVGVTDVFADDTHVLATGADGSLWAWGYNGGGQLGDGTFTDSGAPMKIANVENVVSAAVGGLHSLAIRNNGTIWSWGSNSHGQLGNGFDSFGMNRPFPVLSGALHVVSGISLPAGTSADAFGDAVRYTMVLLEDGSLWSWGYAQRGLGDGLSRYSAQPVEILKDVRRVVACGEYALAIQQNDTLWAWGVGNAAQGNAAQGDVAQGDDAESKQTKPIQIMENVKDVATSGAHTLTILNDGALWTWGDNTYGQLGDGTHVSRTQDDPVQVVDASGQALRGVTQVAVGPTYSLAVLESGVLLTWGDNTYGQLGDGSQTPRSTPETVGMDDAPPGETNALRVRSIAVGEGHVLAIREDGSLWAWGRGDDGQVGAGAKESVSRPTRLSDWSDVSAAFAAPTHSFAVREDGSLWAWGANEYGQLGLGGKESLVAPVRVSGVSGVSKVAAGLDHTLAIGADGSLWAWGRSDYGQAGGAIFEDAFAPVPAKLETADAVEDISTGLHSSFAIQKDGRLLAWGEGPLGDGVSGPFVTNPKHIGPEFVYNITYDAVRTGWAAPASPVSYEYGDAFAFAPPTPPSVSDDYQFVQWLKEGAPKKGVSPTDWGDITLRAQYKYVGVGPGSGPGGSGSGAAPTPIPTPTDTMAIRLSKVTDKVSAVQAVKSEIARLQGDEKQKPENIEILTHFAEGTVANAAGRTLPGREGVLGEETVRALGAVALDTKDAVYEALAQANMTPVRDMKISVRLVYTATEAITIRVQPSLAQANIDAVCVETPWALVTIPTELALASDAEWRLTISGEKDAAATTRITISSEGLSQEARQTNRFAVHLALPIIAAKETSAPLVNDIYADIEQTPASYWNQTLMGAGSGAGDTAVYVGKYDMTLNKIAGRVDLNNTYRVEDNQKTFEDTAEKSAQMQEAIRILASKDVIRGRSQTQFDPDAVLTRAEIAALVVRAIGKLDIRADGGFVDVKPNDWFYTAVGSAKKEGIVKGTSPTTFEPALLIIKEQLTAICARTLISEMGYRLPDDPAKWVNRYSDKDSLPAWGLGEIALAARENLIPLRTDGRFAPKGVVTRGDAALTLYQLFMKIW